MLLPDTSPKKGSLGVHLKCTAITKALQLPRRCVVPNKGGDFGPSGERIGMFKVHVGPLTPHLDSSFSSD